MRYFESKQIHSSTSALSSEDIFVEREITRAEFMAHEGEKTISSKHGFGVAYAESDKRFYGVGFHAAPAQELEAYALQTYLRHGWTIKHPFLQSARSAYWRDEEIKLNEKRAKEGYVIPEWSRDIPPDDYQGGFSNDVFRKPILYDYLKGGGCHGFIGHSVRKPKLDACLEAEFLQRKPDKDLLAMWLTSTGGRHFGDSLEGLSFKEQQKYIRSSIDAVIEQALGYEKQESAA